MLGPDSVCPDCGQECQAIVVDNGIGAYEYWGARYVDSRPEVVSDCCEAPLEISLSEMEPDYEG